MTQTDTEAPRRSPADADSAGTLRLLNILLVVAITDFLLLVPLVIAAITHAEGLVSILPLDLTTFTPVRETDDFFKSILQNRETTTGIDDYLSVVQIVQKTVPKFNHFPGN